jgi:hypothetical protein
MKREPRPYILRTPSCVTFSLQPCRALKAEDVYESVRAKLAPSLESRPETPPNDPSLLDQYELLIEQSLLAGQKRLVCIGMGWEIMQTSRGVRANDICKCNALLTRLPIADNPRKEAAQYLREASLFAERSGVVELQLRCFQAACELYQHLGDLQQSIAEGEAGILLADTCGFGKFSIDIRSSLAETYLTASNYQKALQAARTATRPLRTPRLPIRLGPRRRPPRLRPRPPTLRRNRTSTPTTHRSSRLTRKTRSWTH